MEDGFHIIQYQVKRLCNKPESDTDLFPLFWTSRLQPRASRKLSLNCPWTSEKNPYFHTPAYSIHSVCMTVSLTCNNLPHSQQIFFIFHTCITFIDISDEFEVGLSATHGVQDGKQNGQFWLKFFDMQ